MSSTTQRTIRKAWQVTEKANPFMSKSGAKATQKRNLNDMTTQSTTPTPNTSMVTILGKTIKNILGQTQSEMVQGTTWDQTLRTNIARLVREEEQREIAFMRLMHRV